MGLEEDSALITSICSNRNPMMALVALCVVGLAPFVTSPALSASSDSGDLVLIDAGATQIKIKGLIQTQIAWPLDGDNKNEHRLANGDPAEQAGMRLRRARFGVAGWAYGAIDYSLTVEGTGDGSAELLDAWIGYRRFPLANVIFGVRKMPFSRYALLSSKRNSLAERPLAVTAMAPFRQVGLSLEGNIAGGLLHYSAGVDNGFERGVGFYEGYQQPKAFDGNRYEQLAYGGRASMQPFGPIGSDLADLSGGGLRLSLGTSTFLLDGSTNTISAWGVDVAMKARGFHMVAEYLADTAEPAQEPETDAGVPVELNRMCLVGEMGYMILPEQLGLTARAEWIDDNVEIENAGDALVIGGGLQYYWHRQHLKAQLDYTHRMELHGMSLDNDTLLFQLQFSL
jgi:hypothetical protein